MGICNGRSGRVANLITQQGRLHVHGRGDNIDTEVKVRVSVALVMPVNAANGADLGGRGRRVAADVFVLVAGRNGHEEAFVGRGVGSVVRRCAEGARQATADYDSIGAVASAAVLGNKVIGSNEIQVVESILGVDDLDTVDLDLFGDAVCLGADGSSTVGPMAQVVRLSARNKALDLVGMTLKFPEEFVSEVKPGKLMPCCLQGGYHRHRCRSHRHRRLAGGSVVVILVLGIVPMRDACKAPGRAALSDIPNTCAADILFNVFNLSTVSDGPVMDERWWTYIRELSQELHREIVQSSSKSAEDVLKGMRIFTDALQSRVNSGHVGVVLELDDILVSHLGAGIASD